ncbi:MAG: metal ABC transporter ATP-binding protein [Gordonia sp. (in: high G+C Gram-positive bacteria)]|uniref:metal ABC transporter ATP-binding protein n=1 Tax=Gordonia sp. (in: high G+C Gram-positive bacteria) TaxID=84139 RepID=UPI0039E4A6CD
MTGVPVLEVANLSVSFGPKRVLDDVSFTLGAGMFTGLIGPNGSGKTTLFRAILGINENFTGDVLIDGRPAKAGHDALGYVPQHIDLDVDLPLTALDVAALGLDGVRFGTGLRRPDKRAQAMDALRLVGADGYADQRVGTLSGGQQQRLMIGHALARRPRLLLLDEPFANLDMANTAEIARLLRTLADTQNITILLSVHEVNSLLGVLDHVVYLANGNVAEGTVDQVVRTDVLTKLYGRPVEVVDVDGRKFVVTPDELDVTPAAST